MVVFRTLALIVAVKILDLEDTLIFIWPILRQEVSTIMSLFKYCNKFIVKKQNDTEVGDAGT